MDKTISEQLEGVFQQASSAFVRKMLKSEQDITAFETIRWNSAERQSELSRRYTEDYNARVDAVRQRLFDEAAQLHLEHPAPPGMSTNSSDAIERQAHREVQLAHEADLQQTEIEAQQAFDGLLDRAYQRNQAQGMAVDAFLRTGERRSGVERRQSIRRSE